MKRAVFVPLFVAAHVVFVFVQIHQHSKIISATYQKQKNEQLFESLIKKQQTLTQEYNALQNKAAIKKFAQQELKMQPITIKQIKKLNLHEQTV